MKISIKGLNQKLDYILQKNLGVKDALLRKAIIFSVWIVGLVGSFGLWPFILGIYLILVVQNHVTSNKAKYSLGAFVILLTLIFGIPWARASYDANYRAELARQDTKKSVNNDAVQVKEPAPVAKIETKNETSSVLIPFEVINENDATLTTGTTKTKIEGSNGTKVLTYKITYTDGKESARTKVSEEITVQSINKIVSVGTKPVVNISTQVPASSSPIPATVTPTTPSQGNGYTNVDGNYIKSPGSDPAGATAKCRDGSYSYSQHRSGTCSGHGGVANWL